MRTSLVLYTMSQKVAHTKSANEGKSRESKSQHNDYGLHYYNLTFFLYDLRAEVYLGPSHCFRDFVTLVLFGKAEVSKFRVSVTEDKDVLRLEVSVHNVLPMQAFQPQDDTR